MQRLIQDLLSYLRVESHGSEFHPVETSHTLDWALQNLESAIEESGATVDCEDLPIVRGDRTQLGHAAGPESGGRWRMARGTAAG